MWGMLDWIGFWNPFSTITSNNWLAISNWSSNLNIRTNLAFMLKVEKGEWKYMQIVVKKVPKFLRGFVKLIFGIKE